MMRPKVLIVTEPCRSPASFRRRWIRPLYRAYHRAYQARVARAVRDLSATGEVLLLVSRDLALPADLLASVEYWYYDEESYKVDSEGLARLTRQIASGWWSSLSGLGWLTHRDVFLPDLLPVARGLYIRYEVLDYLGIVERLLDTTKPGKVILVTGTSVPERLARLAARARTVPVEVLTRLLPSAAYTAAQQFLFSAAEQRRIRELMKHPRLSVSGAGESRARRVLIMASHHSQVNWALDLYRVLDSSGTVAARIVASNCQEPLIRQRIQRLSAQGVRTAWLMDFLPRDVARRLIKEFRPRVRALWRELDRRPEFRAQFAYAGGSLYPVVKPFVRDSVTHCVLHALLYLEAAFRTLEQERPDAVLVVSDRRYPERAMALAARGLDVPTLFLPRATVLSRDRLNPYDIGDRILVFGSNLRDALVRGGMDPARLRVLGDPRPAMALAEGRARLRARLCADLGLPRERGVVVVLSRYVSPVFSLHEKEQFLRTVFQALKAHPDVSLVIKAHPNESLAVLKDQLEAWRLNGATVTQSYDLYRLLAAADAAIMVTSMAGLEAMAVGCPVLAVQTTGKDFEGTYWIPYVGEGAAVRIAMGDAAGLARALERVVTDPASRAAQVAAGHRFASRYLHPIEDWYVETLLEIVDEIRGARQGRPQ